MAPIRVAFFLMCIGFFQCPISVSTDDGIAGPKSSTVDQKPKKEKYPWLVYEV